MPYSSTEGKDWIRDRIVALKPESILDVGAGSGTYADLLHSLLPACQFDAVEIYEPYVERFGLHGKYSQVSVTDVRDLASFPYVFPIWDVIVLGDVLEHMAFAEALDTWNWCRRSSRRGVVLSLPIVPYPQDAVYGNPHEAHLHTWSHESALTELGGITEWWTGREIGAYWAPTAGARTGRPS